MAKIIQFQRVDAAMYWLTDDGKLHRIAPNLVPFKPQTFDPKTGKWK